MTEVFSLGLFYSSVFHTCGITASFAHKPQSSLSSGAIYRTKSTEEGRESVTRLCYQETSSPCEKTNIWKR